MFKTPCGFQLSSLTTLSATTDGRGDKEGLKGKLQNRPSKGELQKN
jgi:hypothetical protein